MNSILSLSRYNIPKGGKGLQEAELKQYTAEFLLTRGDYAMLGYSWYGCTGSAMHGGGASPDPPRARRSGTLTLETRQLRREGVQRDHKWLWDFQSRVRQSDYCVLGLQ